MKRKVCEENKDSHDQIRKLYRQYTGLTSTLSLHSSGSTSAIRFSSLMKVLNGMQLTKESTLLDIGCGCGIPCIVAAKVFGCKCYGFDIDPTLVKQAQENAKELGVFDLCSFVTKDASTLTINWINNRVITHVYWFDAVFPSIIWNWVCDILSSKSLNSLSVIANNFNDYVGGFGKAEKEDIIGISMSPSGERKTFYVQKRMT